MNKNIEVINKDLLAVKFSLLPLIKEIDYTPDEEIPLNMQPGVNADGGIMILNKECPGFRIYKEWMPKIMKKKDKQLKREIKAAEALKSKTDWQITYSAMLQVELERRSKKRGDK
ncbi:hypothetical protein F8154_08940 [Alkaliphilus pronyensis]|uniref:Uncharacterized protein n=1 Tax=Alkaliphilus pronyensis TaxID=1482732 RepID=A0A6I0EYA3_9FIRM|nr:hypothetical protein [Alkaliphilus pronyensis]KAB3534420.1 hypothetical protein F8154_08940 [Alkaliphilus pronyensis]